MAHVPLLGDHLTTGVSKVEGVREMKKLLVALGGFAGGAVAVFALVQAGGPSQNTASAIHPANTSPAMTSAAGMMGGVNATASDVQLRIIHVLRGCHVWRSDQGQGSMMRITLPHGARLSIVDQDLDAHQLVQLSGPRLHMPAPMAMMGRGQVSFTRAGVYRLATKKVDLPGQSMSQAKTVGPDNNLRLTVTVT